MFLAAHLIVACSPSVVVTKMQFDKIHEGMSYQDVVAIIGNKGEETASNTIEGIGAASVTTKMYSWTNEDGSNMNAMFQNDKLTIKTQALLK